MDELNYQKLCKWIEQQHRDAVAVLERTYAEQRHAIDALWEQFRTDKPASDQSGLFHKRHGNLIEAVRRSARRLSRTFTLQDVETHLRGEQPLLMAQSSRKSISTALRRLYEARELVLVEEGRGTKPAQYAIGSTQFNTREGKEGPMESVSGRSA
jgi:hypothetical protein